MKKIISLVLALGMSTLLFAACGGNSETTTGKPAETTTGSSVETTTASGTQETTTAKTETTTASKGPIAFVNEDMIDSVDYGYYGKILRDDNGEILGLAVSGWKTDESASEIVFDSVYSVRDSAGNLTELPVIQIGTGQGVVNFQAKLESVEIKEGVQKIANKAFTMCQKLTSLTLPESLTSIGDMAFWNCSSLEEVIIPDSVTEIGNYAFSDCLNLKFVTIPARFESQAANIFEGCPDIFIHYTN